MEPFYKDTIERLDFKLSKRKFNCEKTKEYEKIAVESDVPKEYFSNQYKAKVIKTAVKMK